MTRYRLNFDEAEAIGLDGTGRDLDPRFPHMYHQLTDEERVAFWAYRFTGVGIDHYHARQVADDVNEVGQALMRLSGTWYELSLPGDFIVPELGLPVSMSIDEAGYEVVCLAQHMKEAADQALHYTGKHRKVGV